MTTQNFIERIAQETCALICERTCSSMCSDDLISNAIQSFARKVVEEIGKMEVIKDSPSTAYYEGKIDGRNHAIREAIKIVNSLSGLSGEVSQL